MDLSMLICAMLITFYGAINSNLVASTDNTSNKNKALKHSQVATISDNICNSHEKNVAVDVILIDNKPFHNEGILKNVNKRQTMSDKRREYKDRPRPDQKSLLIIFDGTGSMHDDLMQLRSGAEEIINDLASRDDSPIFNYILVVFRDPSVEPPFVTKNPKELLEKLKYIDISGGNDCPEMALSGLKVGLKLALPNSFVYVFSDASSKDYHLYDEVVGLIQKKQVTINFLLTGDCNLSHSNGYQVYQKLSRVSNGQVYDMNKQNVKDVLVAIRDTVKHNYAALKAVNVEHAGKSKTDLIVDTSISELKVSIAGKNPQLSIRDPSNEIVKANEELTLNNLKLVNIKDPKDGVWKIEAGADTPHSIRLSAISDLKIEFGFSLDQALRKSETAFQPLKGHKNILTLFISDTSLIKELSNVTMILVPTNESENFRKFTIPLQKINENVYATKPFEVPNQMFKIELNGLDINANAVERLISTGLISSYGSAPELNIEANQKEIYEGDKLNLKCIVKSHIPVNISWSFHEDTLKEIHSTQSNELELIILDVKRENRGKYKCFAANRISKETEEISINILPIPKVSIASSHNEMEEDKNYHLKCNIEDADEQKIEILWIDEDETILQNGSDIYRLTPTHLDDGKVVKCRVQNKDFVVENSIALKVIYSPRFITDENNAEGVYVYGSNVTLDCSTMENPRSSVEWYFTAQRANSTHQVKNQNSSMLNIGELFEENEGFYECVVENKMGMVQRDFFVGLIPIESPNITTENDILFVRENESTELLCECKNCLPITNFTWTYDNDKIYEQFFIKNQEENFFKTIMKLVNVDETDNGTFHCSMWNALGEEKVSIELLVQTTPKIEGIILNNHEIELELFENYEILEGSNFSIECIVDGYPEPNIYWMQNEHRVANESLLNIESILAKDEGKYECIAENDLGLTKKDIHVDVNYPPRKKRNIETQHEVIENKNVTLTCDLIGNPRPSITWQINSKDLNMNDSKYLVDDNFLKFLATSEDSGIYRCNGTNKFGHTTVDFSVIVMSLPKLLSPNDESIKLTTNSSLKLNCDAIGYPLPTVKISRNSQIIFNGSNFEIESVKPSDTGSYICTAENQIAITEKIFYIYVVEKPRITSTFSNITILNNGTAQVVCLANGIPEPKISWKQNDRILTSSSNILMLNSSLSNGEILCSAQNSEGVDNKSFFFEVLTFPILLPIAKDLATSIELKENDDLEIICPFENYNEIEWTFNGSSLNDIQHRKIEKELFIHNINRMHNGIWACNVSNPAGYDKFIYNVTVLTSPTILPSWNLNDQISEFFYTESDIDEKVLRKGENLKLNCTANGSPNPKIQWRKGSDMIAEGEILAINELDFHHSDIYTCSAENSQGSVKKFFKVDVISAPYIDNSISIQTQFEKISGDSVILKCNVIANPAPLYFWFKDNEILDEESDDHMIIENIMPNHAGKYRCLAKNKFGSVKVEFEIGINQPAKILSVKEDIKLDGAVELSCIAQGNPMPIISWTLNGHILSSTSKLKINKLIKTNNEEIIYFDGYGHGITFLDPFRLRMSDKKLYSKLSRIDSKTLKLDLVFSSKKSLHMNKFDCYTFNFLGRDEKSIEIIIKEKPYLESQKIPRQQDFEILENMPLLLSCLVSGYPQPQITWFKNGLKIYENETVEFLKNQRFLRISDTFSWHSGNYSCISKNELGEMELKFKVLILSPPKIITHPNANHLNDENHHDIAEEEKKEVIEVLKGSNVILECMVEASPKAQIHWVKFGNDDSLDENELVKTEENFLVLNSVQESMSFICFANNTVGNAQKYFHINVHFRPMLIEDEKLEENITVKLHHSISLECKTKASPEADTYWTFNSTNLTKSVNDYYYFTTDNQIMRITNVNRNHEGKYVCTSSNKHGNIQKVFYIRIEIPIEYTPWSPWSECTTTCGSNGLQYRSRTCVLLNTVPSYNCSGDNIQMRKCNDIPCPVNGGWGNWSEWNPCPKCYDPSKSMKIRQKRFRKCDNPLPSFGGMNCVGNNEEEKECKLNLCPVDGNWSDWSNWSGCSKTCGKGFRSRRRYCNNPTPMHNGKPCDGENYEYEECKLKPCNSYGMLKSIKNDYIEDTTEHFRGEYALKNDENGNPKVFQFMRRREMEYSPPTNDGAYKVKVTLDTYKPISEETYNEHLMSNLMPTDDPEDYFETDSYESSETTESSFRVTTQKNCGSGFKYNQIYKQCEEIDECKSKHLNLCKLNERCINTIGSYRCEKKYFN